MALIDFTDKGLYCAAGRFYIDPWQPVDKAVITHAHSDHARMGSQAYLCHHDTLPLLQLRLGPGSYQAIGWNEPVAINGVTVSLHPAGHIIGSSQVRVEHKGEAWVVSGDYKLEHDGISGAFEPVKCHTFITESTFGLPIYNWKSQAAIFYDIQNWVRNNQLDGKTSVLIAYSLGKAQRVMKAVEEVTGNILAHGAIWNVHQTLVQQGWSLPAIKRVTPELSKDDYKGSVVIAPPSADGTPWMRRFSPRSVGICSGWMQVRGHQRRRNADEGFALSDHADWNGLMQAVKATGAEKVFVTHGFQSAFSRYLNEMGIEAAEVKTEFGTEEEEAQFEVGQSEAVTGETEQATDEGGSGSANTNHRSSTSTYISTNPSNPNQPFNNTATNTDPSTNDPIEPSNQNQSFTDNPTDTNPSPNPKPTNPNQSNNPSNPNTP